MFLLDWFFESYHMFGWDSSDPDLIQTSPTSQQDNRAGDTCRAHTLHTQTDTHTQSFMYPWLCKNTERGNNKMKKCEFTDHIGRWGSSDLWCYCPPSAPRRPHREEATPDRTNILQRAHIIHSSHFWLNVTQKIKVKSVVSFFTDCRCVRDSSCHQLWWRSESGRLCRRERLIHRGQDHTL